MTPTAQAAALKIENNSPIPFGIRALVVKTVLLHAARTFALRHATASLKPCSTEFHVNSDHQAELQKIEFIVELARRLHIYGTSAQRLEAAVEKVAHRLEVDADVWSNPTGMLLSFRDTERGSPHRMTQVIRLEPGDVNLGRLAKADLIFKLKFR